jgi:protein-disulfide isomerase
MPILRPNVEPSDHAEGDMNAPIQLVEYGDYADGACAAIRPVIRQLQHYFEPDLCFVFRNFPRTDRDPRAMIAAETAEFAGIHRRFWEMHELLFTRRNRLERGDLLDCAAALGLSPTELAGALDGQVFTARIQRDMGSGLMSGVAETPTFFVNGRVFEDDLDFDALAVALEEALAAT